MSRAVGTAALVLASVFATQAVGQVTSSNGVSTYTVERPELQSRVPFSYENAKPLPMPQAGPQRATAPQSVPYSGPPKFFPGKPGTGVMSPVRLTAPVDESLFLRTLGAGERQPQEFGTSVIPYTTSRVNAYNQPTAIYYPFSATGKLFFKDAGVEGTCTAALIKPGIIVTAAHCVANRGSNIFFTDFRFAPGYNNGNAPYGTFTSTSVRAMTSWLNGTDPCVTNNVCENDVATINLYTPNGLPGNAAGVYGYAVDGYGFTSTGLTFVAQLGFPDKLDTGKLMQRTDSQGAKGSLYTGTGLQDYTTLIGSLQTQGSSGGPWLVNLGRPPLNSGTFGSASDHNIIIGVTSFITENDASKRTGASRFTSNNISILISQSCAANPGKC